MATSDRRNRIPHRRQMGAGSRKQPQQWMLWGAIMEILRKHEAHGIKKDCLYTQVRGLLSQGKVPEGLFLDALEALSPLVSVHNGVIYPLPEWAPESVMSFFEARRGIAYEAKRAVATYIHEHYLKSLDAVLLDSGSGCEAVAHEMANGDKGHFTVITNNMRALRAFLTNRTIRLYVTGGSYRIDDEALVGDRAAGSIVGFFVKYAVIGVSGITARHVYCHSVEGEQALKKTFWQTAADMLIVPASLDKFAGMDVGRFGELCRAASGRSAGGDGVGKSLDSAAETAVAQASQEEHERALGNLDRPPEEDAPKFMANRCVIVVEPQWMIDKNYAKSPDRKEELWAIAEDINSRTAITHVQVERAEISEEELRKRTTLFPGQ